MVLNTWAIPHMTAQQHHANPLYGIMTDIQGVYMRHNLPNMMVDKDVLVNIYQMNQADNWLRRNADIPLIQVDANQTMPT